MKHLVFVACTILFSACANHKGVSESPGELKARDVEAQFTQNARLDPHTEIQVTQWNAQVRRAERWRAQGQSPPMQAKVDARIQRWDQEAEGKESYMMLIEVRDADAAQQDPRLDLQKWSFRLQRPGQAPLDVQHVEVLSKDRFAATSGGAHWRIGARVDFPATTRPRSVTLEIQAPKEKVPSHALQANLPHLPARLSFPAQATRPAQPRKVALTPIQTSR